MEHQGPENEKVSVEVRNHLGNLVQEYQITPEEAEALPLLSEVRSLLSRGEPALALDKLMEAVRQTRGDKGVTDLLMQGKQQFNNLCEEEEKLAKLESECKKSILEERGQGNVLQRACEDRSNRVCPCCAGIIRSDRMEAHLNFWCPNL